MRMRCLRVETTAAEVAHGPDGLTPDLLHCCMRRPCHLTTALIHGSLGSAGPATLTLRLRLEAHRDRVDAHQPAARQDVDPDGARVGCPADPEQHPSGPRRAVRQVDLAVEKVARAGDSDDTAGRT